MLCWKEFICLLVLSKAASAFEGFGFIIKSTSLISLAASCCCCVIWGACMGFGGASSFGTGSMYACFTFMTALIFAKGFISWANYTMLMIMSTSMSNLIQNYVNYFSLHMNEKWYFETFFPPHPPPQALRTEEHVAPVGHLFPHA